jgi:hypothetical protein
MRGVNIGVPVLGGKKYIISERGGGFRYDSYSPGQGQKKIIGFSGEVDRLKTKLNPCQS